MTEEQALEVIRLHDPRTVSVERGQSEGHTDEFWITTTRKDGSEFAYWAGPTTWPERFAPPRSDQDDDEIVNI